MNYRHIYHAGNFADVFKHVLLLSLLQSLLRKPKPFCYVDTHAGGGGYDLHQDAAQKTGEFEQGIGRLWPIEEATLPPLVAQYLHIVRDYNAEQGESGLRYYPGSPAIARSQLRAMDRMILSELHPEEAASLKQFFSGDPQVAVHHLDAYHALKACLPPRESRGLVLLDPPFEQRDEYTQLIQSLEKAIQRWSTATYAIWYPIKQGMGINAFYRGLQATSIREILCCEFWTKSERTEGLHACGLIAIHPPWQWAEEIRALLPGLVEPLRISAQGGSRVVWLVPE